MDRCRNTSERPTTRASNLMFALDTDRERTASPVDGTVGVVEIL